jgi:chemosensory pili system protein ChpA (sensor histidine kinase/response regulator)
MSDTMSDEGNTGDESDSLPTFDESELSAEDREILRQFEMREQWGTSDSSPVPATTPHSASIASIPAAQESAETAEASFSDELLTIFSTEMFEEIKLIRYILQQFEQDDHFQVTRFSALQKPAHKIRGTAGAMNCFYMARIAHIMEIIIAHLQQSKFCPLIAIRMLTTAVNMLEETLWALCEYEQEVEEPYLRFMAELSRLVPEFPAQLPPMDTQGAQRSTQPLPRTTRQLPSITSSTTEAVQPPQQPSTVQQPSSRPSIAVNPQRIERLTLDIVELAELHTPMERAEEEVEQALQELRRALTRLDDLEETMRLLSIKPEPPTNAQHTQQASKNDVLYNAYSSQNHPTSSLIARILSEASHQPPAQHQLRLRTRLMKAGGALAWEQQEKMQALEQQNLLKALQETLTDASLATARMSSAFLNVRQQMRRYMTQAAAVRKDMLALRSTPFCTLVDVMRQEIERNPFAQKQPIHFEVTGEATEIDQDILRELSSPLVQLLRTCIADVLNIGPRAVVQSGEPHRIWMRIQCIGGEVLLEIGFSMMVQGGAVDAVRASLQLLHGTISSQRNATGGVSFHIRLPRSHGAMRCLQVRVGEQHIIVPFAQVQRIGTRSDEDANFTLAELLALPPARMASRSAASAQRIQPTLMLLQHTSHMTISVAVDEVEREVELLVRPLAPHLQRPGITGAAIDGDGNVLLMVDLPELVRHSSILRRTTAGTVSVRTLPQPPRQRTPVILIADDSTAMRQWLLAQLAQQNYCIYEAEDGIDALEKLVAQVPDVFILDMDMPNLNGFDLLNIMHLYPELANVKVVMLTSHDSERDRRHALELGAHVYLTKQNRQEPLVDTIQRLLLHA